MIEHKSAQQTLPHDFDVDGLKRYLDEVWQSRLIFDEEPEEGRSQRQPFLSFEYAGKGQGPRLRAGKYIGFIQYEGVTIEILPKLFTEHQGEVAFRHLLWWLSYCKSIRFPFSSLISDSERIDDFPEALIGYFARYTFALVNSQPYQHYTETTETHYYLRGRLNTQQYINKSLSRGNWHELVCDHEPFMYNNRLNQIIKYVTQKLTHLCRLPETYKWLEKVLFTLDEVSDVPVTVRDCDSIQLNRFYHEYEVCLDLCRFFLSDHYLNRQQANQRHFCFLLPMDYVFEDFVTGVTQQFFSRDFKVQSQAKGWLTDQRVFQIRNDLLLTHKETKKKLIVDTKYKIRTEGSIDAKHGVSQTDLYQMVSYALRRETDQVLLLYPCRYGEAPVVPANFTVSSGLLNTLPLYFDAVNIEVTGPSREEMVQQVVKQLREWLISMGLAI
ncbi:McrC family protein [Telluribacter sp. SYSU D00476]|uniref:McrC family protein n=1 Tax=Telluribacter sp. SYSU D00476 TaxID=2811430 RepID=UPI001FF5CF9F|nr:McrC family protein [Telluribacter sp. SYSU D00476]